MYTHRSRTNSLRTFKQLQRGEEDKEIVSKNKMATFLPTISEVRDLQKNQAKQLTFNINRFQNISLSQEGKFNEEVIRSAFNVIKSFGEIDNNFKKLFIDMQVRLKPFLFVNEMELIERYRLREGMSYKLACQLMDKFHIEVILQRQKTIKQLYLIIEEHKSQLKQQSARYLKNESYLEGQVEKYKKLCNVEYVTALERKIEDLKQCLSNQQEQMKNISQKHQALSMEKIELERQHHELETDMMKKSEQYYDLNNKFSRTELYLLNLKDRFEELSNKMNLLKETISRVENQNQRLYSENIKLMNRAAASFEDLTPRPKYEQMFVLEPNSYLLPTRDIFNNLMGQLGEKKTVYSKCFTSKRNHKLKQMESVRMKTAEQIVKAREQLHELYEVRNKE